MRKQKSPFSIGNRLIIDITIYGPEYAQSGTNLFLLWQSMINLFLYGRETREKSQVEISVSITCGGNEKP